MGRAKSSGKLEIDAFDRAILRILQRDNKTPQRRIAEAVHLSTAAVQRRVAAMEEAGIIERNVALVDPRALQMSITAMVEVHLVDERPHTVQLAKAAFLAAPEVQQCYYVTGGVSFVLIVVVADMILFEALTRRLFTHNEAVASFRSLLALDRIKTGAAIDIP